MRINIPAVFGPPVFHCLDIQKEPPLQQDHPLLLAPNCICVPHIGYASREAFDIRADIVFDHVKQYLATL